MLNHNEIYGVHGAEIIGSGFNGFMYKVDTNNGPFACSILPDVPQQKVYEIEAAISIANQLGVSVTDLLNYGFLLPIGVIEESNTLEELIKASIERRTHHNPENIQRRIENAEKMFKIHPIMDPEGFNRLILQNSAARLIFGDLCQSTVDEDAAIKDVAKLWIPHKYHLYPYISSSEEPESLKSLFRKFYFRNYGEEDPIPFEYAQTILLQLAQKMEITNQAGFVHGDLGLGNLLSIQHHILISDFKDARPISPEELKEDKRKFAWTVMMILWSRPMMKEAIDVIHKASPFSTNDTPEYMQPKLIDRSMNGWIEQFLHGLELHLILPNCKPVEPNANIARRVLTNVGCPKDVVRMIETFPLTTMSYTEFINNIFTSLNEGDSTRSVAKKKRRRR